jgi:hypothetical protein
MNDGRFAGPGHRAARGEPSTSANRHSRAGTLSPAFSPASEWNCCGTSAGTNSQACERWRRPWGGGLRFFKPGSGSFGIPRINHGDAEASEVSDVPRHNSEVVFQRRGRDQAIGRVERRPLQLALAVEDTPPFRNCLADGQNAAREPWSQSIIEPLPQARAAVFLAMNGKSFADFADTDDAEIQHFIVGILQPLSHARVRLMRVNSEGTLVSRRNPLMKDRPGGRLICCG